MRRLLMISLLGGCGAAVPIDGEGGSSSGDMPGSSSVTGEAPSSTSGASTNPSTTEPATTESTEDGSGSTDEPEDDSSGSSGDGGFIPDPTGGWCSSSLPDGVVAGVQSECSLQDQDCCKGQACKAWANDGSATWNARICRPLAPDAGQAGHPCVAEDSAVTGSDSCDAGLMCWNVDPDTLEGTCAQYCGTQGSDPTCANPDEICTVANEGALPLCLPACDPLVPDCAEGFGCYPASEEDFACVREGDRLYVEGFFHPDCPSGTFGVSPETVEGCSDDAPCCTAFCDQTAESPCGGEGECLPYFEPPLALNPLGYCSIPS